MPHPLRVIIADDEPLARERVEELLGERADARLVAACRNGREAVDAVRAAREAGEPADLLLLDVEMPEMDGLAALAELSADERPAVVFVTAYDRYALQAFDLHALDYLLKPFDDDRFGQALDRAREAASRGEEDALSARLIKLLQEARGSQQEPAEVAAPDAEAGGPTPASRLAVRLGNRWRLIAPDEIDWVEGAGVYARLVIGEKSYLLRTSLADLEERLDPARFVRIHRSTIVNFERVVEVRPRTHGEYLLVLSGGGRLKVSRSYSDRVRALLDRLG
jgi:two-component system LytT family response regulator